jgi:rhodanese-related sulfurtransferase
MELVNKASIRFGSISTAAICQYIKTHPSVVLIDVRTKEEFEGKADPDFGGLANSINIPVQELEKRIPTLSALKEKDIIVFCSHSHRSPRAAYLLGKNGFRKVNNMSGGMSVMKDKACKK